MGESFIYETSNNRLQRLVAVFLLACLVTVGITMILVNLHTGKQLETGEHWYSRFIPDLVNDITPLKLFYISLMGGMIFFPIPSELAFYFSITQGNPVIMCIAIAVLGFILGNIVNYFIGLKMNKQVLYLLSAKTFFSVRRKVNRWGAYAVILLNVLPAPSDVLTVGLGTVRYNTKKLFTLIALGNVIKFIIIACIASAVIGVL